MSPKRTPDAIWSDIEVLRRQAHPVTTDPDWHDQIQALRDRRAALWTELYEAIPITPAWALAAVGIAEGKAISEANEWRAIGKAEVTG